MLGLVKHLILHFFHEVTQHTEHGRLFSGLVHMLCGILLESGGDGIRITALEEHKPPRGLLRCVLLNGKVYAVLSGDALKILDVLVADFDVGNASALLHKLFDGLLAFPGVIVGGGQLLSDFTAAFEKQLHGFGEALPGQLAAFYYQAYILFIDMVIVYDNKSHPFRIR